MQTHSISRTLSRTLLIVGTLIAALGPRAARAQGLEIETNLVQNMTSLGFATMTSGGGARIGLPLGQRTVLLTGLDFAGSGQAGGYVKSESYSVHVPLELKVYLVQPAAGKLVPCLRAGLGYSLYSSVDGEHESEYTFHRLEGLAGAGLNYFFTPGVALGTGINVIYGRSAASGSYVPEYNQEYWSLDLNWQLGVLFRVRGGPLQGTRATPSSELAQVTAAGPRGTPAGCQVTPPINAVRGVGRALLHAAIARA